jgi:hypothetical protein
LLIFKDLSKKNAQKKMMIHFKAGKSQTKRLREIFALKDWIEFLNHSNDIEA